jgi:hypothetical protein
MLDFVKPDAIFTTMVEALEFVKLFLYSDSDSVSSSASHRDASMDNQSSYLATNRFLSSRPISRNIYTEENQYSVRSVRSLRSLHTEWSDQIHSNQNQQSFRTGDIQLSVRSSRRDARPVHVRNLFQNTVQISNVQEDDSSRTSNNNSKETNITPQIVLVVPNPNPNPNPAPKSPREMDSNTSKSP